MGQALLYALGSPGVLVDKGLRRAARIAKVHADGSFNLAVDHEDGAPAGGVANVKRYAAPMPGKPGAENTETYFFDHRETDPAA